MGTLADSDYFEDTTSSIASSSSKQPPIYNKLTMWLQSRDTVINKNNNKNPTMNSSEQKHINSYVYEESDEVASIDLFASIPPLKIDTESCLDSMGKSFDESIASYLKKIDKTPA